MHNTDAFTWLGHQLDVDVKADKGCKNRADMIGKLMTIGDWMKDPANHKEVYGNDDSAHTSTADGANDSWEWEESEDVG